MNELINQSIKTHLYSRDVAFWEFCFLIWEFQFPGLIEYSNSRDVNACCWKWCHCGCCTVLPEAHCRWCLYPHESVFSRGRCTRDRHVPDTCGGMSCATAVKPRMIKSQLPNSGAFFPMADSVYCKACINLFILHPHGRLLKFWAISHHEQSLQQVYRLIGAQVNQEHLLWKPATKCLLHLLWLIKFLNSQLGGNIILEIKIFSRFSQVLLTSLLYSTVPLFSWYGFTWRANWIHLQLLQEEYCKSSSVDRAKPHMQTHFYVLFDLRNRIWWWRFFVILCNIFWLWALLT